MNKKIRELRDQKATLVEEAQELINEGKYVEAKAKNTEIAALNDQIETAETFEKEKAKNAVLETVQTEEIEANKTAEKTRMEKIDNIRKTPEYKDAWLHAIRNGATVKEVMITQGYTPLRNAMSESGGTPAGEDGGFLLPIDFDNMIWTLRRDFTPLADLVTIETVGFLSGWRAVEKDALTTGFEKLTELQPIPATNEPKFVKIPYMLEGYGGTVEISNDLLNDSPVNLMRYLANWMARKSVLTENALILALLNAITPAAYDKAKKLQSLKTVFNKTLDPAHSKRSVILTNQSGFDFLDSLEDTTGRPLLQPDLTNPTQYKALGRSVNVVSDALLPNDTTKAPLYIGDFKEFIDMFRRGAFEMASTNVGGTAFTTNTTLVRGITRLDSVTIDTAAAKLLTVDTAA